MTRDTDDLESAETVDATAAAPLLEVLALSMRAGGS